MKDRDHPGVYVLPPVIFVLTLLVSAFAQANAPWSVSESQTNPVWTAAFFFIAASVAITFAWIARATFFRSLVVVGQRRPPLGRPFALRHEHETHRAAPTGSTKSFHVVTAFAHDSATDGLKNRCSKPSP